MRFFDDYDGAPSWLAASAFAALLLSAGVVAAQDTVTFSAPESSITITASPNGGANTPGVTVRVEGWSCGADVTPDVVAVLAELNRRRSILARQASAGAALAKTPAVRQETDRARRLRTYDGALAAVIQNAPPEIRALTRREEQALAELERIEGLQDYTGGRASLQSAGVIDGGETELHILPDCFETTHVRTLVAQMRAAATEVDVLRQELRATRDAVATGGGV